MFEFCLHVLTLACIYGLIALALNLQAGYTGLLNFGHIAFVGIGAYAVGIGHLAGWALLPSLIAGVLAAMALAWLVARLGRNLASDYWGIATLAVAEIVRIIALNQDSLTGGAQGISALPGLFAGASNAHQNLYTTLLLMGLTALFAVLSVRLANSRFVFINLCRINGAIAKFKCSFYRCNYNVVFQAESAQTQCRDSHVILVIHNDC